MKQPAQNSWFRLASELKRRRVYPVIAAYAVVAFILLQIGEITFVPLGLPNWVMVSLIVFVIVGFPIVIVLAWVFDITPTGIRRTGTLAQSDDKPSIAVLPFVDMSPDKDQSYFCEGVAEEILNALTKIPELSVAARSSSFQFNTGTYDVRDIGRELGVKTILEGSVRKSNDRLRVMLETLASSEQLAIHTTSTSDVSAYEYYLRGRQFFKRFQKMDIEYALQMFREAIGIDPEFALAWAGYADCHSFLIMYVDPQASYREEASTASKRALELDPDLAEAHASRGLACLVCEQFEGAEEEFQKAIELNPCLFEAYYYYARTQFHRGDMQAAAELFKKAAEVDPTDYQSRCLRAQILRGENRREEAIAEAKDAIDVIENHVKWNPDDVRAFHLGAGSLLVLGEIERAKRWLHRAIEIAPDDSVVLYNVACNLATLGETDKALEYLERAVENGAVSAAWMRNDEDLANLRDIPEFTKLLQRVEQL